MSRWILKLSSCSSNAGMETSAPLINTIVNNALLHSNSRIKQMPAQVIHILRFLWYTRCPRFCNEMYWGQGYSEEVIRVFTLLHFRTGDSEWRTECQRIDTAREKKLRPAEFIKNDNVILQRI